MLTQWKIIGFNGNSLGFMGNFVGYHGISWGLNEIDGIQPPWGCR